MDIITPQTEVMTMLSRFALSLLLTALALAGCSMGPLLIHEQRSPYDFDTTLATITANAKTQGWQVPKTFDFQASLLAHGQPDPGRMTVVKLCSPTHASRMFASDASKYVSVMAPCSISVYEKSDGNTYVSTMNMGLMARLMGDEVGTVLADIARDDAAIVAFAGDPQPAPELPPVPLLATRGVGVSW
jgi:uncharacterized protein (DUF302 family)